MTVFGDQALRKVIKENEVMWMGPNPIWLVTLKEENKADTEGRPLRTQGHLAGLCHVWAQCSSFLGLIDELVSPICLPASKLLSASPFLLFLSLRIYAFENIFWCHFGRKWRWYLFKDKFNRVNVKL